MANLGMLVFGLAMIAGGVFVLAMRKAMGRYAAEHWARRNTPRRHHSEQYWTNASTAQGFVIIVLGATIAAVSFLFS